MDPEDRYAVGRPPRDEGRSWNHLRLESSRFAAVRSVYGLELDCSVDSGTFLVEFLLREQPVVQGMS